MYSTLWTHNCSGTRDITSKFIVTGGSGFVGVPLVRALVQRDHDVVVLGRSRPSYDFTGDSKGSKSDSLTFIEWSLGEKIPDKAIFENRILLHLAWDFLPDFHTELHLKANLPNSIDLINDALSGGVSGVVAVGTCFEYGLASGPIKPSHLSDPRLPYAIAKDALHRYLRSLTIPPTAFIHWARLFYMYGPNQSSKSLLAQLDAAIEKGDDTFPMSEGEQLRDYLHVNEVAEQIYRRAQQAKSGCSNICSGKPISIRTLVENHLQQRGSTIRLHRGFYSYPSHEPMAFWGIDEDEDRPT